MVVKRRPETEDRNPEDGVRSERSEDPPIGGRRETEFIMMRGAMDNCHCEGVPVGRAKQYVTLNLDLVWKPLGIASPACQRTRNDGEDVVVEPGPVIDPDPSGRDHRRVYLILSPDCP